MNRKKLVIFGGAAIILAGGMAYLLGVHPPGFNHGQGAIGKRDVYRAQQASDAAVTPGAAPVALQVAGQ
jgi:hypothetical protein